MFCRFQTIKTEELFNLILVVDFIFLSVACFRIVQKCLVLNNPWSIALVQIIFPQIKKVENLIQERIIPINIIIIQMDRHEQRTIRYTLNYLEHPRLTKAHSWQLQMINQYRLLQILNHIFHKHLSVFILTSINLFIKLQPIITKVYWPEWQQPIT